MFHSDLLYPKDYFDLSTIAVGINLIRHNVDHHLYLTTLSEHCGVVALMVYH